MHVGGVNIGQPQKVKAGRCVWTHGLVTLVGLFGKLALPVSCSSKDLKLFPIRS